MEASETTRQRGNTKKPVTPSHGRDEMNIVEFPLGVLSTRAPKGKFKLAFFGTLRDTTNKRTVNWEVIVDAHPDHGLPTCAVDDVVLGLLEELTAQGITSSRVFFTQGELLKRMGWRTDGRAYERLRRQIDVLKYTNYRMKNGWRDNGKKEFGSTEVFSIITRYKLFTRDQERSEGTESWVELGGPFWESISNKYIKKLNNKELRSFRFAATKRIYRWADKRFHPAKRKVVLRPNAKDFAYNTLAVNKNVDWTALRDNIYGPALKELVDAKFITDLPLCERFVKIAGKRGQYELVLEYHPLRYLPDTGKQEPRAISVNGGLVEHVLSGVSGEKPKKALTCRVRELLSLRGIAPAAAKQLVTGQDEGTLKRMIAIVRYFDSLVSTGSHLVSKSPTGFLFRAVEHPDEFALPTDPKKELATPKQGRKEGLADRLSASVEEELRGLYQAFFRKRLSEICANMDPAALTRITSEVRGEMRSVESVISKKRFDDAVHHRVDEKLAEQFGVPSFEKWQRSREKSVGG